MFRKLYIPVVFVVAILIATFSVISGTVVQQKQMVDASFATDSNGSSFVAITDANLLEVINTTVDISVESTGGNKIFAAIGHTADVSAWTKDMNITRITNLKSLTELNSLDVEGTINPDTVYKIDPKSDMWLISGNSETGYLDMQWTKKNSTSSWSMLLFITSPDVQKAVGDSKITLSWVSKNQQIFMIPGIILSILLLVSCIVMHLIWRSQNVRGRHTGESKKLIDVINEHTNEFSFPTTAQFRTVEGNLNYAKQMSNQSLLGNQPLTNGVVNTQTDALVNNVPNNNNQFQVNYPSANENWRYYSQDQSSPYYENQISRSGVLNDTQNANLGDANFGLNRQLYSQGNYASSPLNQQPELTAPIALTSNFETINQLQSAPKDEIESGLTRRQLREKGFLKAKKQKPQKTKAPKTSKKQISEVSDGK